MASKFGGIPLEQSETSSKFGGIPVDSPKATSLPQRTVGRVMSDLRLVQPSGDMSKIEPLTQELESLGGAGLIMA